MVRPPSFSRAVLRAAFVLALVFLSSGAYAVHADPTTSSSIPWKSSASALAVSGSTLYFSNGVTPHPRANSGYGMAVFSTGEAVGQPVAAANGAVNAIVPDGAGGWYVGGQFTTIGGVPRVGLARVLANGNVDPTFVANIGSSSEVSALLLNGSQLIVGGSFTTVNLVLRTGVAAVNAVTGLVQGSTPTINGTARSLAMSGTTLLVGGNFSQAGGQPRVGLAAFNVGTGALIPGFVANVSPGNTVSAVAIVGSAVYLGGTLQAVNGVARGYAAKVDLATGILDPLWNPGADNLVSDIAVDNGVVFIGGAFANIGGQPRGHLAALNTTTGAATAWRADTDREVYALTVDSGAVYAAGLFVTVNGAARRSAANISTSSPATLLPWHPSLGQVATGLAVSGGRVAVVGSIDGWGLAPKRSLGAIDLLSGELLPWAPVFDNLPTAMVAVGSRLVVGGYFTRVDGNSRTSLATFDLASRDLLPLSVTFDGPVTALAAIGDVLYVGGLFTTVNGMFRLNLAAIDLATGQVLPWGPQADGQVRTIATQGTRVFVGGSFTSLIGTNGFSMRAGLGEITPAGAITAFDAAIAAPALIGDIALKGNSVYFSGNFALVQGVGRAWAGAVDMTSNAVLPWNPSLDNPARMSLHRGAVYLAGTFTRVGGEVRQGVARVSDTTGALSAWKPTPELSAGISIHAFDAGVAVAGFLGQGQDAVHFFPEQALGGAPGPPVLPTARAVGSALTIAWAPPVLGPRPTGYLLEAGTAPGLSNLGALPVATTTFSIGGVPPGAYYVRIRAVGAGGAGATSREVSFAVGAATCTTAPQAPPPPAVTVAGSTVVMSWSASPGSAPTGFTLLVGTADGLTNIGALPMGGATSFSTGGVPPGVYFARLVAANACGSSPATPDVVLRVGAVPGPPAMPVQFSAATSGGITSLSWMSPASGGAAASHVLEAGTGPGLANVAALPLGPATSLSVPGVPAGTYYLRVRALNASGLSPSSGELVLVVP